MRIWRLCKSKFAPTAFEGIGAKKVGGRWNSRGTPVVYAAEHLSLAALELLVHLNIEEEPPDMVAIWADVDEQWVSESYEVSQLPEGWQNVTGNRTLRNLGDQWQSRGESVGLAVPSVVVPEERNILLNPEHPEFGEAVTIGPARPFRLDYS